MIYIIRHGKTELNKANVLQGRSNYPLNDEGIKQAQNAADMLKDIQFDYVFSSPLIRAVQTAEIVVPNKRITLYDHLIEMDYGRHEVLTLKICRRKSVCFSAISYIILRLRVWSSFRRC